MIPAADFFTFAYTTALQSDEILTEIILPFRTAAALEFISSSNAWRAILRSPAPPCN